jgi:hypothetical protein
MGPKLSRDKSEPKEQHGREYLLAAASIFAEYAALRYGMTLLAYFAAVFLWLAVVNYIRTSKWCPKSAAPRSLVYLGLLLVIAGATYKLASSPPPLPQLSITSYQVILFKPGSGPYANVYVENSGGKGIVSGYSETTVVPTTADLKYVIKQLRSGVQNLVRSGGGPLFPIQPHEKKWVTAFGPDLTTDQASSLVKGDSYFFFVGTFVVKDGDPQDNPTYCNFVRGNNPNVILNCPED